MSLIIRRTDVSYEHQIDKELVRVERKWGWTAKEKQERGER